MPFSRLDLRSQTQDMYKEYGQDEGVAGEEEEERRCQD